MNKSTQSLGDSSEIEFPRVPLVGILLVLSFGTCFGNMLVCIALCVQPSLQKPADLLIGSLAIADLLAGFIAMPAYLLKKLVMQEPIQGIVCDVFRFSYFLTGFASILSLSVISAERLITIKYPLTFTTAVTHRRVTFSLVIIWLDALIVSSLPLVPWTRENSEENCRYTPTSWWSVMVTVSNIILPFVFMAGCYWCISRIAHNHRKRINIQQDQVGCHRPGTSRQRKANSTVLIIVGVFVVSWFPSCSYYFLKQVCPACFSSSFAPAEGIFRIVVKLLTFFGSFVNPLIYCLRRKEFRKAFFKILRIRGCVNRELKSDSGTTASPGMQITLPERTSRVNPRNTYPQRCVTSLKTAAKETKQNHTTKKKLCAI